MDFIFFGVPRSRNIKMVQVLETRHTFLHPFENVTTAFWYKYVRSRLDEGTASRIKVIDITDRRVDSKGRLITNRIMS